MKKILIPIFLFTVLMLSNCQDYLDIKPKGQTIPSTTEDYDLLLTSISKLGIDDELFLTADDYYADEKNLGDLADPNNKLFHLYSYSNLRFQNPEIGILGWNAPYQNLYVFNKVINEIDYATNSLNYNESDKKRIKAEALYGRALHYFFIVNMFAKHYNKSTAASDKGIPIVLEASTAQDEPLMSSIEEVYNRILQDLNNALANLPNNNAIPTRPSKGSAYALLARIYLYRADYKLALENAILALQQKNTLSNYITSTNIAVSYKQEQFSILRYGSTLGFYNGFLSNELLKLFNKNKDNRFTKFLSHPWDYNAQKYDLTKYANGYQIEPNMTVSVPEMYLTAAECYAREGDIANALKNINLLRKNRIKDVVDKTASDFANNNELLKFVLEERRRELFMNGTRLFDLKRLNLETQFAETVKHPLNDKVYEAAPNSGKLVLPIPAQVKKFNKNL